MVLSFFVPTTHTSHRRRSEQFVGVVELTHIKQSYQTKY